VPALLALVVVTAVWGVTFVQVKDAVELYPLFAFLAVRFAIAAVALAVPSAGRLRTLGRRGWGAGVVLGLLLAAGYALQTAGLERTTVSSAGFITGLYVVFTPILALLLFRSHVAAVVWIGVALAVLGLGLLSGVGVGEPVGDLLVLAASAVYSLQIVLMERYAPRYDSIAFTSPGSSRARWASSSRRGRNGGRARRGRRSRSPWSRSGPGSSASGSPATASARWAGAAAP
jgi:drug/metabolite transporter (DMT)-like permease